MRQLELSSARLAASLSLSILVCLVVVTACSVTALCLPTTNTLKSEEDSELAEDSRPTLPALFDFEIYQRVFKKHYGSDLEKITRQVYFLEKAFAAYISGVAYRNRQKSYYLAVNQFSDRSPQELAMMRNNFAAEGDGVAKATSEATTHELIDHTRGPDPAKLVREFESKIDEALKEPQLNSWLEEENESRGGEQGIVPSTAGTSLKRPPRPLSMDQLIEGNKRKAKPAQVSQTKVTKKHPKSNNPHYDPLALEGITRGLIDQQEPVHYCLLKSMPESWVIEAGAESLIANETLASLANQLPDEMFADLRESGCLSAPRDQGDCAACYAFSGIAMMEYLFCTKTGQLVAFSEQYMIDCAKGRVSGAHGCNGGSGMTITEFVHNFGLELLDNYKYLGREGECPYANDTDLKTTGFYRMDLGYITLVPIKFWPQYLKTGPLFLYIATSNYFRQYGGGVYDGHDCGEHPDHGMVLVGHGREGGQEYWLIRNSFGTKWGEGGYYKLAKSAPERCIYAQAGYAFGTKDGENFVNPRPNDLNANTSRWLEQMQQQQQQQQPS